MANEKRVRGPTRRASAHHSRGFDANAATLVMRRDTSALAELERTSDAAAGSGVPRRRERSGINVAAAGEWRGISGLSFPVQTNPGGNGGDGALRILAKRVVAALSMRPVVLLFFPCQPVQGSNLLTSSSSHASTTSLT